MRRHLRPEPQLALGRWLGAQPMAVAAIDISDGVARDLHRLCRESDVSAEVTAETLPFAGHFIALCKALGVAAPLALALAGGEDYVLLFTLPPQLTPPSGLGCRQIGTILPSRRRGGIFLQQDGMRRKLSDEGWDHLSGG